MLGVASVLCAHGAQGLQVREGETVWVWQMVTLAGLQDLILTVLSLLRRSSLGLPGSTSGLPACLISISRTNAPTFPQVPLYPFRCTGTTLYKLTVQRGRSSG